jgi:hypothetical protein
MYQLLVFYPGETLPKESVMPTSAAETLEMITSLLAKHHACEMIVAMGGGVRLFAVDCAGNRLP